MKKPLFNQKLRSYVYVFLALGLTFFAISLVELIPMIYDDGALVGFIKILFYRLINDLLTSLLIGVLFLPLFFLLNLGQKKIGLFGAKVWGVIIVICQFSLVKYSLTTKLNLGADLLGYSYNDMYKTVSSSEEFSIWFFVPFVFFPLLFLAINFGLQKKQPSFYSGKLILGLFLGSIVLKIALPQINEFRPQNKMYYLASDVIQFKLDKFQSVEFDVSESNAYPLLKPLSNTPDVLSPFFKLKEQAPNIVVLIVEGLGSEFVDNNTYGGFTPYIDSLISKSIYWENFVSNTGRTFGVLPSLLGSLPLGDSGFLEVNNTPSHNSLLSILKDNGYTTSFYTGDASSFDNRIKFLEYNNVDFIIDENQFGPGYTKAESNSGGFSWGYPDSEIYKKMLSSMTDKKQPRLDVVMSLSNHEPFTFPGKNEYLQKVDNLVNSPKAFQIENDEIIENKAIFASLMYTDTSIKNFMNAYAKRPDFENTIFIITGDHRLIPIEQKDKLCRFHVPLLIYSPLLSKTARFKSVSSHWDVAPSIVSLLNSKYQVNALEQTAWIGSGLDTVRAFRNTHQIGLMRYKGGLKDFIYKEYLLSDGDLYKIKDNFGIYKVQDKQMLKEATEAFQKFKQLNTYVTSQDKIIPPNKSPTKSVSSTQFTAEQQKKIDDLTKDLALDQVFQIAREKAFNGDRITARLLCEFILNTLPNHVDARVLMGRTLAWDGDYTKAEVAFLEAIKRFPFYDDPYLALLDLYWWSEQDEKGVVIAQKALKNNIKNPNLSLRLAKAYKRLEENKLAVSVIDSLLIIYPKSKDYLEFKKSIK